MKARQQVQVSIRGNGEGSWFLSENPFPGDSRGTAESGDNGAQELRRMGSRTLEWLAGRK